MNDKVNVLLDAAFETGDSSTKVWHVYTLLESVDRQMIKSGELRNTLMDAFSSYYEYHADEDDTFEEAVRNVLSVFDCDLFVLGELDQTVGSVVNYVMTIDI